MARISPSVRCSTGAGSISPDRIRVGGVVRLAFASCLVGTAEQHIDQVDIAEKFIVLLLGSRAVKRNFRDDRRSAGRCQTMVWPNDHLVDIT